MRVRVDSISKVYSAPSGRQLVALEDVSLDVGDGEFVTILGPSGCGKSTLLQVVAGLEAPTRGRVVFESPPPDAPLTAVVFQEHALFPWRTVRENVTFGLEVRGVPAAERLAASRRLLALVGLEAFADRYPHHLSGGMRQRVAIARALAVDPELILYDEPTADLDPILTEQIGSLIARIRDTRGATQMFVTHNVPLARAIADRIAVLDQGRIAEYLTPEELPASRYPLTQEFLRAAGLEHGSGGV